MKILAFTPTYRLEPETLDAICRQDYQHGYDAHFTVDNPYPQADGGRRNVLYNYQRGRRVLLSGDWSGLWVVESDVIPPPYALTRMVDVVKEHGADVVYGVYLFRQPWPKYEVVNVTEIYYEGAKNRGEPWKERPLPTGVTKCSGSGIGCTLITRHVLEAIDFRMGDGAHCDSYFNDDVYTAGYQMMCDWSVICGHKLPTGETIWPR